MPTSSVSYERKDTRNVPKSLMDFEAGDALRTNVIGLLDKLEVSR